MRAFLIEKSRKAFQKLSAFGTTQSQDGFNVSCLHGAFEDKAQELSLILQKTVNQRAFLFALIDPKGWSRLSMEVIAPMVQRRSAEVLVNVMSSFISRFVEVESCQDSYETFFGRPGVREIIRETPRGMRQDTVVREYCRSLRLLCNFKFVSSCVILEPDKKGVKYFMVFATNDSMGIKVFKEAETHAAAIQDDLQTERIHGDQSILPLGLDSPASVHLRERYRKIAFQRVEDHLKAHPDSSYEEVFCKAMSMPLVTERELISFLDGLPKVSVHLEGRNRNKPDIKRQGDRVCRASDGEL